MSHHATTGSPTTRPATHHTAGARPAWPRPVLLFVLLAGVSIAVNALIVAVGDSVVGALTAGAVGAVGALALYTVAVRRPSCPAS